MTDDNDSRPTPTDLEELARSISMNGIVGRHDGQGSRRPLRRLARIDQEGRA